jgi:hypothetical protein
MSVRPKTSSDLARSKNVPAHALKFRLVHPRLRREYTQVLFLRERLRLAADHTKKLRHLHS